MRHNHRIIPGYAGGDYSESNVVSLSVTQHAMWHYAEWSRKGCIKDKLAWKGLAGLIGKDEILAELACQRGLRQRGETRPPRSEETKRKIGESQRGKFIPLDQRERMSASAKRRANTSTGRQHLRSIALGRKASPETIEKLRADQTIKTARKADIWRERLSGYDFTQLSFNAVAKELGTTHRSVSIWARRLNLTDR